MPPPSVNEKFIRFGEKRFPAKVRMPLALICLPFLSVEAHAEAEGIDGEREDNCRTLLGWDRIECLQKPDVNKQSPERSQPNPSGQNCELNSRPDHVCVDQNREHSRETKTTTEAMMCLKTNWQQIDPIHKEWILDLNHPESSFCPNSLKVDPWIWRLWTFYNV